MSKATEDELAVVHGELAALCRSIMAGTPLLDSDGRAVLKPDGQPHMIPPSAAYLAVIRQLLKDNRIEVAPGAKKGPLHGLADLPEFDDDNVVHMRRGG